MHQRFFCQGGVHYDYLWSIQDKIHIGHSHPATQIKDIGGVAFNVALAISITGEEVHLQSAGGKDSEAFLNDLKSYGIQSFHRDDSISSEMPEYHGVFNDRNEFVFGLSKSQAYKKLPLTIIDKISKGDHHIIDSNVPSEYFLEAVKRQTYARSLILVSAVDAEKCLKYLPYLDNIFMNGEEAQIFLDEKESNPEILARKLVEKGVKEAFVTLGADGVIVANQNEVSHVPGNTEKIATHVNGAGDTFAGLTLAFKAKGFPGIEAAEKAQKLMPYYLREGRQGLRRVILDQDKNTTNHVDEASHHVAL